MPGDSVRSTAGTYLKVDTLVHGVIVVDGVEIPMLVLNLT